VHFTFTQIMQVFGRPFVKRLTLCYRTVVLSACNVGILWPNGWMDQYETWHGVGLGHIVLDQDPAPPQKAHSPPILVHVCCGQIAGWIKMPLGTEVGLGPGHIMLDGDPALLPQIGAKPPILAHVCCSQTAGSIKMPFGTEVGVCPGDIVRMGTQLPLPKKGGTAARSFRPMSVVAKRLDGSRCDLVGRPTSIPNGVLIHPAVWPQHTWTEKWGHSSPPPLFGPCQLWPNGCCAPLCVGSWVPI